MAGKRDRDAETLIAGRERDTGDDGTITLSGRCGECGYLIGAPGHQVTCGK